MNYEIVKTPCFPIGLMECIGNTFEEYHNAYKIMCANFTDEEDDAMIDGMYNGLLDLCSSIVYLTVGGASITLQHSNIYKEVYKIIKDINLIGQDVLDNYIKVLDIKGIHVVEQNA